MKFANKIFGQNLKQFLKDAGLKQTELAEKLKVSDPTVSDWIAGKYAPEDDKLPIICNLVKRKQEAFLAVPASPTDIDSPDPVYERLVQAKSSLERPTDFVHLLDLFLDAPENIRAVALALLASDQRIAEPYYSDFAVRRAHLLRPE